MKSKLTLSLLLLALGSSVLNEASAQTPKVEFPAPSPACTIKQRVGLTDIEIAYSRPGVKGRKIFDGIVPYGQVWRTGANQATTIKFSTPVKFAGAEVPAGTYALFTIPSEGDWTVILNKKADQWGAYGYDEKEDLTRVKVPSVSLGTKIETLTIEFNRIADESAIMNIVWDQVVVPVKIEVSVAGQVNAQIDAAMAAPGKKDAGLYYQSAMFYFDHKQDLGKALDWLNTGLKDKPEIAFEMLNLKARILAKQGDKEGAIAAAKKSSEIAVKVEGANSSFVKMNDDLISSLQ